MKHSIAVKFIAIALCALSVVAIVAGAVGIIFMEAFDLYEQSLESWKENQLESEANAIAWSVAEQYATQELGNIPENLLYDVTYSYYTHGSVSAYFYAEIYEKGTRIYETGYPELEGELYTSETMVAPHYPIVTSQYVYDPQAAYAADTDGMIDDTGYDDGIAATDSAPAGVTEPMTTEGQDGVLEIPDEEDAAWTAERDEALAKVEGQEIMYSSTQTEGMRDENGNYYEIIYNLDYYQAPEYTVRVTMNANRILGAEFAMMTVLYTYRDLFLPAIVAGLLIFAITLVYLCCAAGRRAGTTEVRPAGLNRVPLDLYALAVVGGVILLAVPVIWLIESAYYYESIWDNAMLVAGIMALCVFGMALLVIAWIFAFAAQVKSKGGYWWRHMVLGWCLGLVVKFFRWLDRGLRWTGRGCRAVFRLLPVIWQWLLTAVVMVFAVLFSLFLCFMGGSGLAFIGFFLLLASIIMCVVTVCYGGYCFGILLKGAKHMSQGNVDHKINTLHLYGAFREFGNRLNNLAEGAKIAAERQMKSERMKTELITNVSHDIKTPLTSIINYVDLMKKPHSEAEGREYLEVLDRQSQRLKKLIDDLMEMSKASTGNMTVELGAVDAVEAVNQALGEFADKLASQNLTPVFRHPEHPVTMRADGRLVWRVLSNLLSNAYKYALPDTRLYIDLMVLQGNAVIAIKNISRDQLNVNADELMERFVRGDSSRNTEGSGLGLNIARSLVELQQGQMHLMVDGDLFKVTLIFPMA